MNYWRESFLDSACKLEDKIELEIAYEFGDPATSEEIRKLESALSLELPKSLSGLLSEFNGIDVKQKYWGSGHLYFNTEYIANEIPLYFRESGNFVPGENELSSVVFFAQQNGLAVIFALCVKPFNGFKVGEVLSLESDTGEFESECDSLQDFVQSSEYCHLG